MTSSLGRLSNLVRIIARENLPSRSPLMISSFHIRQTRSWLSTHKEDYDAWYSHGCSGGQTNCDEGVLIGFDTLLDGDTISFDMPDIPEPALEYDFEDEFVDFAELEYWPSSSTSTSNDEDFNKNVVDNTVVNSRPRVALRDTKN